MICIVFCLCCCPTGLKSLCFLSLDQTKVSDVGMMLYLQSAPSSLSQLSLNQTSVTEATLAVLPACTPQLRLLSIKHTKVGPSTHTHAPASSVSLFLSFPLCPYLSHALPRSPFK